ncbi:hypothetical protein EU527_17525 [Candidatus Thorarchaeota archaeon]|nr:MAG: hypothetical protein EU527_17525 [Candidatus Thorarchaeota archaeon]
MSEWIEYSSDWGYWINPDTFRTPRIKKSVRVGSVLYTKKREVLDSGQQIIATSYGVAYEDGVQEMDKKEVSKILANQILNYMRTKKMYPPNTKIKRRYANSSVDFDYSPSEYDSFIIRLTPELVKGDVEDFLDGLDDFKEEQDQAADERWKIEAAKSGRASCRTCDGLIAKGELRLGEPSIYDGHVSYRWHHLNCMIRILQGMDLNMLEGYDDLNEKQRLELQKHVFQ